MKHPNVVDKARSSTSAKAQRSKTLYAKNAVALGAASVAPAPVRAEGSGGSDADAGEESTLVEKIGAGLKKNPRSLAVAGGVVATVAVATTLALGENVGKTKFGRKVVEVEKKAMSRAKKLVSAVKSIAVAKSMIGSTAKKPTKKTGARAAGASKRKMEATTKSRRV